MEPDDTIPGPSFDLVNCDHIQCSRYGEHVECYFDFEACEHHITHQARRRKDYMDGEDLDDV